LAWQEAHVVADDVRIAIEPEGRARFEHVTQVTVVRGPYRGFDLAPVDPTSIVEPQVICRSDASADLAASATLEGETIHVRLGDPKVVHKGKLTCATRYTLDAARRELLVVEGGLARFVWTAPRSAEGFDTARVTVSLPSAPTEPAAVNPETGELDRTIVSSLGRLQQRDELQMTRPHIPRGGRGRWAVRFDARAVTVAAKPPVTSVSVGAVASDRAYYWWIATLLAAALGAVVVLKDRAVRQAGGGQPIPLIRVPAALRATTSTAIVMLTAWVAIRDWVPLATALLALAVPTMLYRVSPLAVCPRSPGQWFILKPADAFGHVDNARLRRDMFDCRGIRGVLSLFAVLLVAAVMGTVSYRAPLPGLLLLGVGVPLTATAAFLSGGASQHAPAVKRAIDALAPLYRELSASKDMRVVPWARMPTSSNGQECEPDEMRVLLLPQPLLPGLRGLEVAVAFNVSLTAVRPSLELLVRTVDGSRSHAAARSLFADLRPQPGRKPDERVWSIRLPPRTREATERVVAIASVLRDVGAPQRVVPTEAEPLRKSA
jgi:hypothetical protein